ncbi:NAD(P)/FAD-dependent oxidoreductase [Nocardioides sp. YIM 152588]|uniref:NAD(P)/FAD-dependent oxidoreductase n=1 Tax=Nocardioides sp. YIM 152588 TaxID=3158259 RepID=UPI0032E37D40
MTETFTSTPSRYDVVVVGGGAAGLSAALVLARAGRRTVVVDAGAPRNASAGRMNGFLSRDGLPPSELLATGRSEIASYGGELVAGRVTAVRRAGAGGFAVALAGGDLLLARRVLVTTGLRDVLPDLPGVRERWGRDLLHCPYCHGHEVRDRRLGVLGGAGAVAHALIVRQWSGDVTFFEGGVPLGDSESEMLRARGIEVVEGAVARLAVEDDRLAGVELADGRRVERDAVFVRPAFVPHGDLLVGLGCATDDAGWVVADPTGRTSQPGVWVAGNVVDPRAQVITAAGEGSAAAIAINNDLVDEDVHLAVHALRLGSVDPGGSLTPEGA